MKIVVMKFGGTSVADISRIKNVASIINNNYKKNKLVIVLSAMAGVTNDLQKLTDQLKKINLKLWVIEEEKRICEKNSDFGEKFIQLSRNVYLNNDKRAKIKSDINKLLGSNIKEVKSY